MSTAYTATPITAAPEHLARVKYDAGGLVPAIVQEAGTGAVLMLAYMNDDALRADAGDRPHLVLVPQPAGVLVQGRDVGRPAVRAGGLLRLRRRHAAVRRRPGREGRLPHRRADVLLPQLRRPGRLSARMTEPLHPSPTEFAELAQTYTVVPVWREVLADLETPVSVFLKLVGGGEGFLLESVEHGERWGRYSFVGRDPALTLVARAGAVLAGRRGGGEPTPTWPPACPTDRGALGALEALLARFRAPRLPDLPPFHGGIVGWLGYDVVREIERLPNVPADDPGLPDAVMSLTGHVAAFDHFRQRIYLIENVLIRPGAGEADIAAAYEAAAGRLDALVDDLARPLPYQPVAPPDRHRRGRRAAGVQVVDGRRRLRPGGGGGPGAHPGRRHLPGGAGPAVRLRARLRPVRRLPGAPPGQPVALHVLPPRRRPGSGVTDRAGRRRSRWSSCSTGGSSAGPIAGTRRRGRDEAADKRLAGELARASQGAGRARHAGRPGPQRRRAGWCASAPSRSTS